VINNLSWLVSKIVAGSATKCILSVTVPFLLYFKRNLLPSSVTYASPFRENAIERINFLSFSVVGN
jgi:hypothetical protein